MDDLYRDEILEHYRNPHNFGTLEEPTTVKEGANPLCGDRITLMLGIDDHGNVSDVAFTGRGCAISQASASMLTDEIKGKPLTEIAKTGAAGRAREPGHRDQPGTHEVRDALARNAQGGRRRPRRLAGRHRWGLTESCHWRADPCAKSRPQRRSS